MSAKFATVQSQLMYTTLLLQISLKENTWFGHVKHSGSNLNYMNENEVFMLLSYSDLSSLFQLLIMLVHFVLIVFLKNLEGKDLFSS